MRLDPSYCPCALLLVPLSHGMGGFGLNAILLDGHHKLEASVRLKRPCQILVAQVWENGRFFSVSSLTISREQHRSDDETFEDPAFPWANAGPRDAFYYYRNREIVSNFRYTFDESRNRIVQIGESWPEDEDEYKNRRSRSPSPTSLSPGTPRNLE